MMKAKVQYNIQPCSDYSGSHHLYKYNPFDEFLLVYYTQVLNYYYYIMLYYLTYNVYLMFVFTSYINV